MFLNVCLFDFFFLSEPLHALPLARLLALSCDELGYFVSTYTHMICYGAMVLSHALLSTPASAVAVFFVLAMAALQVLLCMSERVGAGGKLQKKKNASLS